MNNDKTYNSIWEYLDEVGVLENGTEDEIKQAKKEYWRIYQRQYKRRARKQNKEVPVRFTKREIAKLEAYRANHRRSLSRLVHDASLAYTQQKHLVPDPYLVGRIEQQLALIQQSIYELKEQDSNNWFSDTKRYRRIEKMLENFESELYAKLRSPVLVLDYILWAKDNNPEIIEKVKQVIDHDYKG